MTIRAIVHCCIIRIYPSRVVAPVFLRSLGLSSRIIYEAFSETSFHFAVSKFTVFLLFPDKTLGDFDVLVVKLSPLELYLAAGIAEHSHNLISRIPHITSLNLG